MAGPNIRISQQLKGGYNPDGAPGTISTGVPGPPPSDTQVSTAVEAYLKTNPASVQVMNQAMVLDPVMLGPGANGANDVVVTVSTNGSKDAWIQAGNGADPLNKSGRQPVNLYLLSEFGGSVILGPTVSIGSSTISYGASGAAIAAPDKVTVTTPNVTVTGSLTALGNFSQGQQLDPGGLGGFNTLWPRSNGGWYTRAGTGSVSRLPVHWGSGTTSFPTTSVLPGDLFQRTDVGPTVAFRYNGTAWRQCEPFAVADLTARNAIPTGVLHNGFRVWVTSQQMDHVYDGTTWRGTKVLGPYTSSFGGVTLSTASSPYGLCSVSLPDPGFPYLISALGRSEGGSTAGGTRWDTEIYAGSSLIALYIHAENNSFTVTDTGNPVGASGGGGSVPGTTPFTGSTTVTYQTNVAYGSANASYTSFNNALTATIHPA